MTCITRIGGVPILSACFETDYSQPWVPATHDTKLLPDGRFLFWMCVDEQNEVLRRVIDLEELADDTTETEAAGKKDKL